MKYYVSNKRLYDRLGPEYAKKWKHAFWRSTAWCVIAVAAVCKAFNEGHRAGCEETNAMWNHIVKDAGDDACNKVITSSISFVDDVVQPSKK